MRFKTDENLPEEFAQVLRDAGYEQAATAGQTGPFLSRAPTCRDAGYVWPLGTVGLDDDRARVPRWPDAKAFPPGETRV